jgi:fatty acid desaturase
MRVDEARITRRLSLEESAAAYRALRRDVEAASLLDRALGYYTWTCARSYALFAIGIGLAFWLPAGPGWTVTSILVLGFAVVQVALVGHDAGHLAVFKSPRRNHRLGLVCWSLTAGVGFWYWCDRHNRHHANTNDVESDPDLGWTAVVAHDEQHAAARRGWLRVLTPYQAFFAAAFVPLVGLGFRIESWVFALRRLRGWRRLVEVTLLAANLVGWMLVIILLDGRGIALFVGTQAVASAYLSFIIAPNHKGMPVWAGGLPLTFVERQVLSTRNLTSGPIWDVIFGGLNYQIEHHLFPQMPRVHLRRTTELVRPFCQDLDQPYEVASPFRAFADIFIRAHRIGQAARTPLEGIAS